MNKIEQMFYDAIMRRYDDFPCEVERQKVIGIYKVDFAHSQIVVEIDGHDFHKTKEQREYDYKRERYLMKNGYVVVRFMATEVYLNPDQCVNEFLDIIGTFEREQVESCLIAYENGKKAGEKQHGEIAQH
jgi:very-short-patch-repair endonuclease